MDRRITHGKSNTRTFRIWWDMMRRCYKPQLKHFRNYGGRGILVCERWHKFENFLADIGERPGPGFSLDRIDNEQSYSANNCRWATKRQQVRNRRTNRFVTWNGETKCIAEWAETLGMKPMTIINRLDRGWNLDIAMSRQVARSVIHLAHAGRTLTLLEWARETGVAYNTLKARFYRGWDSHEILALPGQHDAGPSTERAPN